MLIKTIFAGFGGQGVLSMGYVLAYAAMVEGLQVTYLPSYGAEVRGGTANCTVAVSNEEIASPIASAPDNVVVMNNPSLEKFQHQILTGGVMFINNNLVASRPVRGDIVLYEIPSNDLAHELGSEQSANMVMLGGFIEKTGLVKLESIRSAISDVFKEKKKAKEMNLKALDVGFDYMRKNGGKA
jgi:2-oxoglutarate ferredoxin oxidoreductase subunit gamma